ncbi:MAG: hypothetical protein ACRC10_10925 [Thermoguttaceae bacterium]
MNSFIIKLAIRESAIWISPFLVLTLLFTLLCPTPLIPFTPFYILLGISTGLLLALRTFGDFGGVRPYLFSRPFSPKRLFLIRFAFGNAVLFGFTLLLALILLLGIRQITQQLLFQSGWYPMIRTFEVRSLLSFLISALLAYQTTLFFIIRAWYIGRIRRKTLPWLGHIVLIFGISILSLFYVGLILYGFFLLTFFESIPGPVWDTYRVVIPCIILQLLILPKFGCYCYSKQDVES